MATIMYGSETWPMLEGQKSRVRAVEMGYLRSACRVTWRDRWSNERVLRQCGMKVDVIGMIKKNVLRWFGHMERMESGRMTKRVYMCDVEDGRRRGRPRVRWKDRVREYVMREGGIGWDGGLLLAGDRQAWGTFCRGHPG